MQLVPICAGSRRAVAVKFRTRSFAVKFFAVLLPRGATPADGLAASAEVLLAPAIYDAHAYPQVSKNDEFVV